MRRKGRLRAVVVAAALAGMMCGPATTARALQPPSPAMAGAGAGILPWLAVAAVAALGIGAVAYAMVRRRAD
ncbi:hypothetical protein AB0B50_14590 [Streptomyces sp. NPDC041068]|uniref:hypothetical protein n=1 Tax=Streptomyces sp. NPDC041068 TaxID=3155130 RepID=UPI0033C08140